MYNLLIYHNKVQQEQYKSGGPLSLMVKLNSTKNLIKKITYNEHQITIKHNSYFGERETVSMHNQYSQNTEESEKKRIKVKDMYFIINYI